MTGFVITQLSLCDFRGFSGEKSWTLGPLTKITGHNYQGKSSIADAIAFALTGAPYFGGRDLDRLHNSGAAMMWVEAVLRTDEGKTHTVHRIRQNGRTVLSVDGATTTQERFAERFGSKDLILSLLNPLYFAEVLGGDGRKLIEQYLSPVSYETVLSKLSETMRELLKDEAISVPATYVKSRREELKELEKDRLVLNGQMEQTEMQRAKLQKDLAEKQALLAHTAAAFAPLEKKQNAQDFSAIDAELQKLSAQYDAVQDNSAETARSELQSKLKAVHSRGYASENTAKLQKMQLDLQMLYGGTAMKVRGSATCKSRARVRPVCGVWTHRAYPRCSLPIVSDCRKSARTEQHCGSSPKHLPHRKKLIRNSSPHGKRLKLLVWSRNCRKSRPQAPQTSRKRSSRRVSRN